MTSTEKALKGLIITLTFATIAVIVAKDVLMAIVFAASRAIGISGLTYLQMWALNAVIAYVPPLVIYAVAFRNFRSWVHESSPSSDFKYALLPIYFVALYALAVLSNLASHAIARGLDSLVGSGELRDPFAAVMPTSAYQWAIMFVFVGIVATVAEEVIYRRLLLEPLRRFGDLQAVVITALLFAALHGNFTQFLYAFTGGLILGIVTVRSNSLIPAIVLHSANNIFTLGLAYYSQTLDVGMITAIITITGLVALAALIAAKQASVKGSCPEEPGFSLKAQLLFVTSTPAAIGAVLLLVVVLLVNMVKNW